MNGEKDLAVLLKTMQPKHISGDYVFCTLRSPDMVKPADSIMFFREEEGNTVIIRKELADSLQLHYSYVAAWISLTVHSSLEAVGLTAAFSAALSKEGISCNVVAGFYHDHIFVDKKHAEKALLVLNRLSQ